MKLSVAVNNTLTTKILLSKFAFVYKDPNIPREILNRANKELSCEITKIHVYIHPNNYRKSFIDMFYCTVTRTTDKEQLKWQLEIPCSPDMSPNFARLRGNTKIEDDELVNTVESEMRISHRVRKDDVCFFIKDGTHFEATSCNDFYKYYHHGIELMLSGAVRARYRIRPVTVQ